jgi:hypothetical protein
MFTFEEKPWNATDVLPFPPAHLRPYIKEDFTQDWEIVDESIPDEYRKEFEEWHKTLVQAVKDENERQIRWTEDRYYKKFWHERRNALWNHKEKKVIKFAFEYNYTVGFIASEVFHKDMSFEELKEYVEILDEGRKNWLAEVKRQESIPGYLPDDFDEKNLKLTIELLGLIKDVTFEEIMYRINKEIEDINEDYKQRLLLRSNNSE